jgi:hypothetical protein
MSHTGRKSLPPFYRIKTNPAGQIRNFINSLATELELGYPGRYWMLIGLRAASALIPNPSPKGRREHDSKSLSPWERDLG